ncbi:hypothetical protein FQN57_001058 [Myotisia sp. PD_48]|nr:hypothetical protein FQN57_001058 [Myotisia sp. PD_48]
MITVAIAGSSGLAQYIAHFISTQTSHSFIILSRTNNPELAAKGWQVIKVDYNKGADLQYALKGVDTVISTISGSAEIKLIDAAAQARVRRFVPSEFEGPPLHPSMPSILDRGNSQAIERLQYYQPYGMRYTVFVCGIFYERFAPGGMRALQLGKSTHIGGEGDFLLDIRNRRADLLYVDNTGQQPVYICMTSCQDLARFLVAALQYPNWPNELRMYGSKLSVTELVHLAGNTMCEQFQVSAIHTKQSLLGLLQAAKSQGNLVQQWKLSHLLATTEGCYNFGNTNLQSFVQLQPETFQSWIGRTWAGS